MTTVDVFDTKTGHVAVRGLPTDMVNRVQDGFKTKPTIAADDETCPICGDDLDRKESYDWSREGLFCPGCGWEE